jgi:hypothetical protein
MNTALFVNYNEANNYDQKLYDVFYTILIDLENCIKLSVSDVMSKLDKLIKYHKKCNASNGDYLYPIVHLQLQLEYLKKATVNSKRYFDTEYGNLELNFYAKVIDKIYELERLPLVDD